MKYKEISMSEIESENIVNLEFEGFCIKNYPYFSGSNVVLKITKNEILLTTRITPGIEEYEFIIKDNLYYFKVPKPMRPIPMYRIFGFPVEPKSSLPHPPHYVTLKKVCTGVPGAYIFNLPEKFENLEPGEYALVIPKYNVDKYVKKLTSEYVPKLYKIRR